MKRFPFLDWMRGLAILLMIQCHTFNSFARMDLREGGPYVLSQFIGGMAAPLFLFMAGMTLAFQMESLRAARAEPAGARWGGAAARRVTSWGSRISSASRIALPACRMPRLARADEGRHPQLHGRGDAVRLGRPRVFETSGRIRFALLAGIAACRGGAARGQSAVGRHAAHRAGVPGARPGAGQGTLPVLSQCGLRRFRAGRRVDREGDRRGALRAADAVGEC